MQWKRRPQTEGDDPTEDCIEASSVAEREWLLARQIESMRAAVILENVQWKRLDLPQTEGDGPWCSGVPNSSNLCCSVGHAGWALPCQRGQPNLKTHMLPSYWWVWRKRNWCHSIDRSGILLLKWGCGFFLLSPVNHKAHMDRKDTKMFISLLRGAEVVSKCQVMNRRIWTELARSAIISWSMSLQTTDTNYYDAERDK